MMPTIPTAPSIDEYLTQSELARRWRLSHRTLERWRCDGKGPTHLKIGGRVLYRLSEVEAFEVQSERKATAKVGAHR
jgi:hypothetical protein